LDGYSKTHDLVLVAAGKGEINRIFERDLESGWHLSATDFGTRRQAV
jgi:hypothetical protein